MMDTRGMESKSKKVEQGDATRQALLRAARQLFGANGYAATSLDDIVEKARVTKGALYHHFSSKEELFRRVFEAVKKEVSGQVFPARAVTAADTWEDLLERCRAFVDAHVDARVQRIVLLDARAVLSWQQWQDVERDYGTVMLRAGLRRAMHRGVIDPQPLHALAMILGGALTAACMLVANADDPAQARREATSIVERLLEGLRSSVTASSPSG
jgi:AcrR family transcriptional regulator